MVMTTQFVSEVTARISLVILYYEDIMKVTGGLGRKYSRLPNL